LAIDQVRKQNKKRILHIFGYRPGTKAKQERILHIFGYMLEEPNNEIWRFFRKFFRDLLTGNLKNNNIFTRFGKKKANKLNLARK
jgi:hypothetical protein